MSSILASLRGVSLASNMKRFKVSSKTLFTGLLIAATLLYFIFFPLLRSKFGFAVWAISFFPVLIFSWIHGSVIGIFSALVTMLTLVLLEDNLTLQNKRYLWGWGGLEYLGFYILVALIVGRFHEIRKELTRSVMKLRETQTSLNEAVQYSNLLFQIIPGAIFTVDRNQTILSANRKLGELLGYESSEILGKHCSVLSSRKCRECVFQHAVDAGPGDGHECLLRSKTGQEITVVKTVALIRNNDNEVTGAVEVLSDITARKKVEIKLESLSYQDSMTGLSNRRYFDICLARLEGQSFTPTSIIVIDLDELKETNDREGHSAGDRLIQETARFLENFFRREDIVARIGGDEFAVVLSDTEEVSARQVLNRLEMALSVHNVFHKQQLKMSFGVATSRPGEHYSSVMERADLAMYRKKNGEEVISVSQSLTGSMKDEEFGHVRS